MSFHQALALHQQGNAEAAAGAYQLVLQADPTHLDALIHLASLRLGQGRHADAETLLTRALALAPASSAALGSLAALRQAQSQYADAATLYEQALTLQSDLLDARFGLAACRQALGQHDAAIACYEAILAVDPGHAEASYGLATLLTRLGRVEEAAAQYRAALAADPDFAEASFGLGKLLSQGSAPGEAIDCFREALDVDPDYVEARVALATTLSRFDRDDEAMGAFHAALASEPDNADARNGLGVLLDRRQRHADAMAQYQTVLAREPDQVDAMAGMANVLKNLGRHAEALEYARRVVALRPQFGPAASLLGSILAEIGANDEARRELRRSVSLGRGRPEALYHLALLGKVQPDDDTIAALETALATADTLPPREQCLLYFALAKACDDVGERDRGFALLLRGNAIKRARIAYAERVILGAMDEIRRVFTADFLAARRDIGDPAATPVFIIGMPRSGTTLVEQMLASHPFVYGAGERSELSHAVARLNAGRLGAAMYPAAVWTLTDADFRRMGADYIAALRPFAPEALRITDKMPGNFLFAGLIRLILPNARIIHTRRDPVDTCLSCFSKLFAGEQAFAYDLAELGRYCAAYRRLMAHWRAVLPDDVMIEIDYESLVADFETQARRIVAHCGLDWDPACLEFYKTDRPVHTASMTQVRQPIYRSSVGRWRPEESLLRPLLHALDEGTDR
ncbi:MAG TPA: sulfotransferase [Acetobacteraceae bacterium]|nr:sulfotransferase [Acetobacteraceae bacterium]